MTLWIGTDRGLFRVTPKGEAIPCGPSDTSIRAMACDEEDPSHFLAGGRKRACLLESRDGGRTWVEQPAPGGREVWALLFHQGIPYAGTGPAGLFRRETQWQECAAIRHLPGYPSWSFFPPDPPHILTIHASQKTLWAGIEVGGIIRSGDGGGTWEEIGKGVNEDVHRLHLDPGDSNHLYVGAQDGLYESRDGGDSWSHLQGTAGLYVHAIAAHRERPNALWIQGRGGPILRSSNGGKTWEQAGRDLPHPDFGVDALDIDGADPDTLYYGAGDTIYRIWKSGQRWEILLNGLPNIRRLRRFLTT